MACRSTVLYSSLAVALLFWCQLYAVHAQEGSITATLTVTPGVLVPESIGFVQACVTLNDEPTGDILITLQTVDGNAQAGSDYENVTAELTFSAGPTLTQCVNITIFQDSAVENSVEFFAIEVATSNSGVTFSPASGMLNVIIQEDVDQITIGFEQGTYTVQEDLQPAVEVCAEILQGSVERSTAVTFMFGVQNGLADSSDYILGQAMGSFQSGDTQFCTNITILADNRVEGTETFTVTLIGNSEVEVSSAAGIATVEIIDNDGITVSLQSVAPISEPGNDGNSTVDVCVTVEDTPGPIDRVGDIVITFNTILGTAGSGDFIPLVNQTLTIPPTTPVGNSMCQQVIILGDTVAEDNETFTIMASVASPDIIEQPATVNVTLMDDDDGISVSLQNVRLVVNEPGDSGGRTTVNVCVTLDSAPGLIERAGVITFNTEEVTAGSGDFESLSNLTRNISPANPVVCQPITILGDDIDEENETFIVIVSVASPDNITSPNTVTVTIIDDVELPVVTPSPVVTELPVATQLPVVPVQDVVVIAVPTAVAGVILIVVIIIFIVLIVAYCRKKKTSHKYVLNYHTVYGNQQTKSTSIGEIATSSPQNDGGESGDPSNNSGGIIGQKETETAETFQSTEQPMTSVINENADSDN